MSFSIFAVLLALHSAGASAPTSDPQYPLLDWSCAEYPQLGAERVPMAEGLALWAYQDEGRVWFCIDFPVESLSALDLYIDTPRLGEAWNLHQSAQLGEWLADHEHDHGNEGHPWWDIDGWFGTTAHFNGYQESDDGTRRARFKPLSAIELVIEKERFGSGEWALNFEVGNVQLASGDRVDVVFPQPDSDGTRRTWSYTVHP